MGGNVGIVGAAPNSRGFAGVAKAELSVSGGGSFSTPAVADTGTEPGKTALNGIRCKYP